MYESCDVIKALEVEKGFSLRQGLLGAKLSTFSIGGPLEYLLEVNDEETLVKVLRLFYDRGIIPKVLGGGSNVLINSKGLQGWVLRLGRGFNWFRIKDESNVIVGGGTSLMSLSRDLSNRGLSGLEFAGGIPASVGGSVRMNAGAHGSCMAHVISWVEFFDQKGEKHRVSSKELEFKYRYCGLLEGAIVTQIELSMVTESPSQTQEKRAEFLVERKQKQPLSLPSAGSIFKNPSTDRSAGEMIEGIGLKGAKVGGAEISMLHGNWIVNPKKNASHSDVLALINLCQINVQEKYGVWLEPEVVLWTEKG